MKDLQSVCKEINFDLFVTHEEWSTIYVPQNNEDKEKRADELLRLENAGITDDWYEEP